MIDVPMNAIRERRSTRTFEARLPAADTLEKLAASLGHLPEAPFGAAVRVELLELDAAELRKQRLGTYGVIKGARAFLAGAVGPGRRAAVDYGYVFEHAVLCATELGLATCWLGLTFRKGAFSAALQLADDEQIPAVSPVGSAHGRRSLAERVMRLACRSRDRRPFESLFFGSWPDGGLAGGEAGVWSGPLEMVRLAPSAVNKQPWRVIRAEGGWRFYRKPGGASEALQHVDMGIALCHFELGARAGGLSGRWAAEAPAPTVDGLEYIVTWMTDA